MTGSQILLTTVLSGYCLISSLANTDASPDSPHQASASALRVSEIGLRSTESACAAAVFASTHWPRAELRAAASAIGPAAASPASSLTTDSKTIRVNSCDRLC